jgi:endoglucanase
MRTAGLAAVLGLFGFCALTGAARAAAIVNGSMSLGEETPQGWDRTHVPTGELRVVRDTDDFVKGPASLRVESVGGSVDGNCNQPIEGAAGETFTVRGHAKARGLDYAAVSVLVQDQEWQMLKWQDLFRFADRAEWTPFEAEVSVPAEARNTLLLVLVRGEGAAWVDELEVSAGRAPVEMMDLSRFAGDPPRVEHVAAVAPDVLSIVIRTRQIIPGRFVRYEPQPGDELRPREGKGSARELVRGGRKVGLVVGEDAGWLQMPERVTGVPLQQALADRVETYTIASADDADYADGVRPAAVYRKSRATDEAPELEFPQEHRIYLALPSPLQEGAAYDVKISGLNVDRPALRYVHRPAEVRSEAVHASQVGFRPDDPAKVAFLSLWMGTGGGYAGYRPGMEFSLIDEASGKALFNGRTQLAKAAGEVSPGLHAKGRNFNVTDVYEMDFSAFDTPGTYRVCVDGIGCSYPFPVADGVWEDAFKVAARGYYHQRSGIALEEPHTDWTRPRGFHADDGKVVYETTFRRNESRGQGDTFTQLVAHRTERVLPDAWGGYFDAGDWDRHIGHLKATRKKLELIELFPDYFARLNLNLPESANELPDLLDEALWNLDCYRRMQTPEGGIRGGIESEAHPAPGETSWTDTLLLMAFAPDYGSSWTYAGVAARAAHWMREHGLEERAAVYGESALRAMEWAEREFAARHPDGQSGWHEKDARNLAALELYRLTGDARWHELFRDTCGFLEEPVLFQWGHHVQRDAAFIYARLPDELAAPQIKRNAAEGLVADAEDQLAFGRQTGFRWSVPDIGAPLGMGKLSAPQAERVLRAHALTGDPKYLRGAVLASHFGAGANPLNTVMVTGVGRQAVQNLLVVDARRMGRKAPPGITPYGPMDLLFFKAPDWVIRWKLVPNRNVTPPIPEWPVTEAYWDIFSWPMMCEYTVHQGMPETLFVWGYLAARE